MIHRLWGAWVRAFDWLGRDPIPDPDLTADARLVQRWLLAHPKAKNWTYVFLCVGVPLGWDRARFDRAAHNLARWMGVKVLL